MLTPHTELLGRPKSTFDYTASSSSCSGTAEPKKRRRNNSSDGQNSDWEFMQSILTQTRLSTQTGDDSNIGGQRNDSTAILFPYIPLIFYTMHLLYEDLKLNAMMIGHLPALGEFLYQLSYDLQLECYSLHYFLDHPKVAYLSSNSFITESETKLLQNQHYFSGEVPNIFRHIYELLTGKSGDAQQQTIGRYPYIGNVNELSKRVIQIMHLIVTGSIDVNSCIKFVQQQPHGGRDCLLEPAELRIATAETDPESTLMPDTVDLLYKQLVYTMIDLNVTRKDIERLPTALHYIFAEALEHIREVPPIEMGEKAYRLLLRPELLAHGKPDSYGKSGIIALIVVLLY